MRKIVIELMNDWPIDSKQCVHKLSGEYYGVRECHIEPDWLLIYDKSGNVDKGNLTLIRTGSHSELF
jgi:mRNA interferase YafQ